MGYLDEVGSPTDLKRLSQDQVQDLAQEIRDYLVKSVSLTGGHLGPNLGVVELTLAMHRVFHSPKDSFIFDTGHQSYVHKLVTGRRDFSNLRKQDGLSGYPSRAESDHDVVENSHASTALSWADGIARANVVRGIDDRHVVAVIGDGALTGGMAWEALNNIAESDDRRLVIIVNDNGRSYSPTIGGLARHLDTLRTTRQYEGMLSWGKRNLPRLGIPGQMLYDGLHGMKKGVKNIIRPQGWFEDLGIKYLGPIDGHDLGDLEHAFRRAQAFGGPVLVHVITEKGRGYRPAEQDLADRFHAVGQIHPETGLPVAPARFGWTKVFADEIVKIGRSRSDVVALTAAMLQPVGLLPFSREFPQRTFDVGIAEQHAATAAAGMAFAGLHPVVALYATFLNRAFDQVLMDVALHRAGVTFVLDRAGITGDDGASHNGMWDLALMRIVPGIQVAAPRDEATLRSSLREAVTVDDGPTVVRYPKGAMGDPLPAVEVRHGIDVLARFGVDDQLSDGGQPRVVMVAVGAMAPLVIEAAQKVAVAGYQVEVLAPTWVIPVSNGLLECVRGSDLVVTVEDGVVRGGVGALIAETVRDHGVGVPVHSMGISSTFLDHAARAAILDDHGLTEQGIADATLAVLARDRDSAVGD